MALWPIEKETHFMSFSRWFGGLGREDQATKHYEKGLRLGREKKWQDAAVHFTKTLEISPSFVQARFARANAYFHMEEWDQTISDFSHILETNPMSVDALVGRASAYASKAASLVERYHKTGGKQYRLSFEEFTMPIDQLLKSVSPEKALWIRTTNVLMELQAAAKRDAEEVLKSDPNNQLAHELLRNLSD
jgi:tetratricopeptide (TPR) repeat protein